MNPVILILIITDLFQAVGFDLISPLISVYITEHVQNGSIFFATIAYSTSLVVRGCLQLPISRKIDKSKHKILFLIVGNCILVLNPLLYIVFPADVITVPIVIVAHGLLGLGNALAYPAWLAIWSINLDKGHEGFEWSIYSSTQTFGSAITTVVGGYIAEFISFFWSFILNFAIVLIGNLILISAWYFQVYTKRIKHEIVI